MQEYPAPTPREQQLQLHRSRNRQLKACPRCQRRVQARNLARHRRRCARGYVDDRAAS